MSRKILIMQEIEFRREKGNTEAHIKMSEGVTLPDNSTTNNKLPQYLTKILHHCLLLSKLKNDSILFTNKFYK